MEVRPQTLARAQPKACAGEDLRMVLTYQLGMTTLASFAQPMGKEFVELEYSREAAIPVAGAADDRASQNLSSSTRPQHLAHGHMTVLCLVSAVKFSLFRT